MDKDTIKQIEAQALRYENDAKDYAARFKQNFPNPTAEQMEEATNTITRLTQLANDERAKLSAAE